MVSAVLVIAVALVASPIIARMEAHNRARLGWVVMTALAMLVVVLEVHHLR